MSRTQTVYREHKGKQERNTADREIRPAPDGLKLAFGSFYKIGSESELDKSRAVCKLCHSNARDTHPAPVSASAACLLIFLVPN